MLRDIAAAAKRTFILIDPRAPDTDRWQPISGDVGEIVARTVEPIKASEEYYSDMLRLYLGVVARVLHHAGAWPPSLPFLIDCCQLRRFPKLLKLASDDPELHRRVTEAGDGSNPKKGAKRSAAAPSDCKWSWAKPGDQCSPPGSRQPASTSPSASSKP